MLRRATFAIPWLATCGARADGAGRPRSLHRKATRGSAAIALGASLIANFHSTAPRSVRVSAVLLFLPMWPAMSLQFSNLAGTVFAGGTLGLCIGIAVGLAAGVGIDRRVHRAG